jgi:hypothetical protein
MGPRTSLHAFENIKISCLLLEIKPQFLTYLLYKLCYCSGQLNCKINSCASHVLVNLQKRKYKITSMEITYNIPEIGLE